MLNLLLSIMSIAIVADTADVSDQTVILDPIVVVGQREPVRLSKSVNSVIAVTPKMIQQTSNDNLYGFLNNNNASISISSVNANGYGLGPNGQGKLLIRGLGYAPNRGSLVLIDGRPDIAGLFGHPLPDTYRKAGLSSAEMVKGGASTLYGTNAIAGVLDLHSFYRPDLDRYTNFEISSGSYNTYNTIIQHSQKFGKAVIAGWHEYIESDNQRDNSEYYNRSTGFRIQLNEINNYNLFLAGRLTSFDFTDAGAEYSPLRTSGDIQRYGTTLGIDRKDENSSISLRLYNSYGEHAFSDGFNSIDRNNGLDIFARRKNLINKKVSISGGFSINELGGNASSPARLPFPPNPPVVKTDKYSETEYAVHLQSEIELNENINLTFGGRYINHDRYDGHFVYQGGVVYASDEYGSFKFSTGTAYRSPTISELVLLPPGNEDLLPEENRFYEIGYFKKLSHNLSIESAVFYREGENLIQTLPNPSPPPIVLNQNSGEYFHNGYELNLRYFNNNWQSSLSYLHLNQDKFNLSVPEDKVVLNNHYNKDNLSLNFETQATFKTASDSSGVAVILDDYLLFNADIKYSLNQTIDLSLRVDNLFDSDYRIVHGYPMPGITFRGAIAYRIY